MTVPKCTSWRGHKFEGRYSEELPNRNFKADIATPELLQSIKTITYECDICVRCGHVIDHNVEKAP